jgi:HSP20 family protein
MAEFGREFVPLRQMMDRLFESAFTPMFAGWETRALAWDVYEDNDNFYVHCYLPGCDPNALDITVQDSVLTISGQTKRAVPEHWRPLVQELPYGEFRRQLTLSAPVDTNKASAEYTDGILRITLPKAEAAKARQIKVIHGGEAAQGRGRR